MTESEWLVSSNPLQMLEHLNGKLIGGSTPCVIPSDNKLRWWIKAIRDAVEATSPGNAWQWWDIQSHDQIWRAVHSWSSPIGYYDTEVSSPRRAQLLREIVGNPFRPVTLPRDPACKACDGSGSFLVGSGEDADRFSCRCCPWITPIVRGLAEAAYAEPSRLFTWCAACQGKGNTPDPQLDEEAKDEKNTTLSRAYEPCECCQGTGVIKPGFLDPERLAILADALEESGCDDPDILRHLRGEERSGHRWITKRCPCVRGCHVLDAILGRE